MPFSLPLFQEKINDLLRERMTESFPEYLEMMERNLLLSEADRILCERGRISENDLLEIYSNVLGVPLPDEDEFVLPDKLETVNLDYLETHCILPSQTREDKIILFVCNPYHMKEYEYAFRTFFEKEVEFELARRSLIERMLAKVYHENENSEQSNPEDEYQLRQMAAEARIVRLANEMLSQALEQNASDIHIEPEETALVIRFRVDGILRDYLTLPLSDYPAVASRIKLIGGLNIAESRLPQDGRTQFRIGRDDIDIRISTIPIMNGESIVMRLLRKDSMRFDLRELGMSEATLKDFQKLIKIPHGIILVVGPTGSGKTTTLYSAMQQLNDRKRKIITIEDPVEYQMPGLSQMQVNPKIDLTFASGLRHIVRQDPDVILVGEIRDHETADIAINAALTGHLVLSTLHTNDAAGAITRLLDMGIEPFLVASALCGVLSQRLIRTTCSVCQGVTISGSKCRNCGGTGYKGRMGVYELLIVNESIRTAVANRNQASEINAIAVRNGMIPLLEDGKNKVRSGITTEAEILRIASGMTGE